MDDHDEDEALDNALATPLLHKAKLPGSVRITPSFLGSRLYATSSSEFFVASGKQVVRLDARLAEEDPGPDYQEPTVPLSSLTEHSVEGLKHDGPISCLAGHLSSGSLALLGVSDMLGGVSVSIPDQGSWRITRGEAPGFKDGESGYSGLAFDATGAHLAVVRAFQKSLTIFDVATMKPKRTMCLPLPNGSPVDETDNYTRRYTTLPPNAMTALGGGFDASLAPSGYSSGADGLVAVAEHNQVRPVARTQNLYLVHVHPTAGAGSAHMTAHRQVSLWDHRVSGRGASVARFAPSSAPLYAVAWGQGVVGCAGADRSVFVYDPRKWSCCGRAMGVSKGEGLGLAFSAHDPRVFYLLGVDSQWEDAGGGGSNQGGGTLVPVSVNTGGHKGTHVVSGGSLRKVFDFRAYGRWIAGHKLQGRDVFVGVCDQQNAYVLPEFNPLQPPRSTRPRTAGDTAEK